MELVGFGVLGSLNSGSGIRSVFGFSASWSSPPMAESDASGIGWFIIFDGFYDFSSCFSPLISSLLGIYVGSDVSRFWGIGIGWL